MRYSAFCFFLVLFFHGQLLADPLLEYMLNKNGDVYVLISVYDPSSDTYTAGELYAFKNADNYRRHNVITAGPLVARLPGYVGFSVDKFGHIKLFRSEDDMDGGAKSILDLLSRVYPGESGAPTSVNNSVNLISYTSLQGISAGWRYVISPDGTQGWKKVYMNGGGTDSYAGTVGASVTVNSDMDSATGVFRLKLDESKVVEGDIILPPIFKTYPRAFQLGYHGGFWNLGHGYSVEHADTVPFTSYSTDWGCCGPTSFSPDPETAWGCYYLPWDDDTKANWVLYDKGPGNANSFPLSPPIGAIFMIPHCCGGDYRDYGSLRAAVAILDVKKRVMLLNMDSFLADVDNTTMRDYATDLTITGKIFNSLIVNSDYYMASGDHSSDPNDPMPVASTTTFASKIGRWNHCGDLCGRGDVAQDVSPPPPPMSTAYASSFGENQSSQKLYMIKVASTGPESVETYVVQLQTESGNYTEKPVVKADGTAPLPRPYDSSAGSPIQNVVVRALGDMDVNWTDKYEQNVYKAFASDLGVSCPDSLCDGQTPRALGFSKRGSGETDYVYITDLPPTHFTVSSNFWGTGGTIWYADESGGKLKLHFRKYNHTKIASGTNPNIGVIDNTEVHPKNPIKAIGADGDNNVYFIHSHDNFEGPEQLERLFGNSIDKTSIEELCATGRISEIQAPPTNVVLSCPSLPNVPVPIINGELMDPIVFTFKMPQHAGFVVEKVVPLEGALPEKVGIIPRTPIGTCTFNVNFPLDAVDAPLFTWLNPAIATSSWVCNVNEGDFASAVSNVQAKIAIINVPNPPSAGSATTIDIVNPCDVTAQESKCVSDTKIIQEDKEVVFRMENPPHFAGVSAGLGNCADPRLNVYEDVRMISNYLPSGWDFTKTLTCTDGGLIEDLYWDKDNRNGIVTATLINQDISKQPTGGIWPSLMNTKKDLGSSATQTMRWRWLVRSITPPHSLIDYTNIDLPYKPAGYPNRVKTGCEHISITAPASDSDLYALERPEMVTADAPNTRIHGLLYDSCWQDMDNQIASSSSGGVFAPDSLDYKFIDPGNYEVTLMIGALGFDLNGISYLSDPSSIQATMIVTWYIMPVTVGAQEPAGANPYVTEVRIAANDLENEHHLKIGVSDDFSEEEFRELFLTDAKNARPFGQLGTAPVEKVHYYDVGTDITMPSGLIVTQQDQLTPLFAEAKLQFFRSEKTEYRDGYSSLTLEQLQTKIGGLGSWDFTYQCPTSSFDAGTKTYLGSCGKIDNINLVDKSSLYPSNYSSTVIDSVPVLEYTTEYGYDATADISSHSSRAIFRNIIGDLEAVDTTNFDVLHQGTLAHDNYYPGSPTNALISSAQAFYTWYDMKYAWFIRYKVPHPNSPTDDQIRQKVLRTGNLAEIFLLNYYASHHSNSGVHSKFQALNQLLAPDGIKGKGSPNFNGRLILPTANEREFIVRVPLLNYEAFFTATDGDPIISEMNGKYNWSEGVADQDLTAMTIAQLLNKIHPMKYPIPTGVTVLEIGFQIFAPVITLKGRPILNTSGAVIGYSYFDVTPATVAPVEPAENWEQLFYTWNFGDDNFHTWANYGNLKSAYGLSALDFGLQITDSPGGFIVGSGTPQKAIGNASTISYTKTIDHFVEILVADAENPSMAPPAASLNLNDGQSNQSSFEIEITDRSPFSHWLHYDGSAANQHEGIPALSNFYYEMGYDPRNNHGLGLLQHSLGQANSFAFLISDRTVSEAANIIKDNHAFVKDQIISMAYPDRAIYGSNIMNSNDFYYYSNRSNVGSPTEKRPDDRFYRFSDWSAATGNPTDSLATDNPIINATHFANQAVDADIFFPPTEPASLVTSPVFKDSTESENLHMKYAHLRPYYNSTNNFDFPINNHARHRISLKTPHEEGENCLVTQLPTLQDIDECYLKTTWEVERDTIIAPFFFNNDYGLQLNIFAVGQDARLFGPYQSSSDSQEFSLDSMFYRLSGKTNTDFSPSDIAGMSKDDMISNLQKKIFSPYAQQIGSINVSDRTPPSLRVTLIDHKTRASIYHTMTMVTGLEGENSSHDLEWSDRVNLYRSLDPRNSEFSDHFNTAAKTTERRLPNPSNAYRIGEELALSSDDFFFQIPEDTRFSIKATMSDNVTGQQLKGQISIGSGTCPHATADPAAISGLTRVLNEHQLQEVSISPAHQYLYVAELTVNHLYPQADFWDEIVITAIDENGNSSTLCLPVMVIRQTVHFRQTGQDRNLNR